MKGTTITEYFESDHYRLDELFKSFQRWKSSDYPRAKESFVAFKFGLQRHIVWEEDVLFPLFEKKMGVTFGGPTLVMRMEHRQIAECLESIHQMVKAGDPNSGEEEQKLLEVLKPHNQKEENILYPTMDQSLSEEERADVFTAMKNIPETRYLTCCQSA